MRKYFIVGICIAIAAVGAVAMRVRALEDVTSGSAQTSVAGEWVSPIADVWLRFRRVTSPGITTVTRIPDATKFASYDLGSRGYRYRISTTAAYDDIIEICIAYDPAGFVSPFRQLIQIDGEQAENRAQIRGFSYTCGETRYLSEFAIAEFFGMRNAYLSYRGHAKSEDASAAITLPGSVSRNPFEYIISMYSPPGDAIFRIVNGSVPARGVRMVLNGTPVNTAQLFIDANPSDGVPVTMRSGYNELRVSFDAMPDSYFYASIRRAGFEAPNSNSQFGFID
ncbi:MAG: hypothetical protein Q8Q39_02275 [bacterium]|nr:hypothetical protein [bacterium]